MVSKTDNQTAAKTKASRDSAAQLTRQSVARDLRHLCLVMELLGCNAVILAG